MWKQACTGSEVLSGVRKEGAIVKKILSAFLYVFYALIVIFAFFGVVKIYLLPNFVAAVIFEAIGLILLLFMVIGNIFSPTIKLGYFAPLVLATVLYTIALHIINIALSVLLVPTPIFILVNLILLFVYCLLSIPMYCMGRR